MKEVTACSRYFAAKKMISRWIVNLSKDGDLVANVPSFSKKRLVNVDCNENPFTPIELVFVYNQRSYRYFTQPEPQPFACNDFYDNAESIVVTEQNGQVHFRMLTSESAHFQSFESVQVDAI